MDKCDNASKILKNYICKTVILYNNKKYIGLVQIVIHILELGFIFYFEIKRNVTFFTDFGNGGYCHMLTFNKSVLLQPQ